MSNTPQPPDKEIKRDPPPKVKRELRKEVGFSCPIPVRSKGKRCGNPYLTWHHFDPPWEIIHHCNPKGMIALCQTHHDHADGGAYTIEQLRGLKQKDKSKNIDIDKENAEINWMRHDLLAVVGGNFYSKSPTLFQYDNNRVIWFERDEQGYLLLNIDLSPLTDKPRISMRNNYWGENLGNPIDFECPPSGKRILARYDNGDKLMIRFDEIKTEKRFRTRFRAILEQLQERQQQLQKELQEKHQQLQKHFQEIQSRYPAALVPIFEFPSFSDPSSQIIQFMSFPITSVEIHLVIKDANIKFISTNTIINKNTFIGNVAVGCKVVLDSDKSDGIRFGSF